jgi:Ca-activated chloride channel homolog
MIRLLWPWVLALAPLPLLVRWLLPAAQRSTEGALRVPFFGALQALAEGERVHALRRSWLLWPAVLAWALLVLAAARPQWIDAPEGIPSTGRDLLLAVDLSGSMRAMDFQLHGRSASRLDVVQHVAGAFLEQRVGDRVGLVVFGTRAHLYAPLTRDRETVRALLEETEVGLAGEYTAIGDAIGVAVRTLKERPAESRVLVLLTDGANTAGELTPAQAARLARAAGIRIYAIGVGPSDELPVPNYLGVWQTAVAERVDQSVLVELTEFTGGLYLHALDTDRLTYAYSVLDTLEPSLAGHVDHLGARPLYPWPLGAALLVATGIAWRRVLRPPHRPGLTR